ncbi:fibronectin type III domain-containing protein [Oerskovia turbata]|uniref:Fibronectin type III domain-containing protein n=1 Tax=Oerskovia turbata TaxID=1713 RepID=A0A4Q1KTV1_9CELL|nr:Ig-like domain-containing protein [Oerskovia turbata]RXR23569.1 fibronectin type III domain-containing protein [Oerskovia turbata]RXR32839.1 fibronectin type III domain-containing protein [Oerskovia turbata]TGJ95144.1 hypothetical protein DLJ96_16100 [Actinotalea fermentans ATCC 43279 = JCM 9966 = DSM 3133]
MTFLARLHDKRRSIASVSTVSVFSALLVAFAVTYDGQATADVELNDSGVWVTRTSGGALGRFNVESQALDGSMLAGSASFDVLQNAGKVLLVDDGAGSVSPVDVARLKLVGSVRPPTGADVAMGGSSVAVLDGEKGLLWVLPFAGATSFDPETTEPVAEVDGEGVVQVSQDGTVYALVPATGELTKVSTAATGTAQEVTTSKVPVAKGDEVELTTVGSAPVVLNRTRSELVLPSGDVVPLEDGSQARLQQPGPRTDAVAVATASGLVLQPVDGGDSVTRAASGVPSSPVQLNGCTYGAWSQTGQVLRDCDGTDGDLDKRLEGLDPQSRLEYRVNRTSIVLNDLSAGTVWMAAEEYQKVDDWELVLPEQAEGEESDAELTTPEQVDQFVLDRSQPNQPPLPQDDAFGARPGRTTLLPVLGNDVDPDGDVMTATLAGDGPDGAQVQSVLGGAALQAIVPEDAGKGTSAFRYAVSDGRGGVAEASVRLNVSPWSENAAPEQTGEPVLVVEQGKTAEIKVLPFFRDPDGDDLYLAAASATSAGDEVRSRPDGTVVFRDGGGSTGRKTVTVTVADGMGGVFEGVLHVDVSGAGQLPPVAVADHVVVPAGQPVLVEPLLNDHDANGDELRLASVSESAPAQITPNYGSGTFQFLSNEPRSYDLTYQVSDGPHATTGLVRVDVLPASAAEGPPIVVSDTALLPSGGKTLVDVLANDTDPGGGVLVVQSVSVPDDAGVSVAVLAHQMLRITEIRRLDAPVTIEYTVSNGTQTTVGQVRVVPVPSPTRLQPPNAVADEATVRVGDVVTIPVLTNDTHPDGLELFLQDEFEQGVPPEQGELFVSEGQVRFKAGTEAGTAYAIYRVRDKNGQEDSAQLTIHIRDGKENSPPQPQTLQARVLTGATVRIAVPLDGIDPDGDSVQLTGIATPSTKGTAEVTDRFIDYKAAEGATGSDSFTYSVLDARGMVATGTVQVGISAPPATNQSPVAVDDLVTVRPGRTVAVPALANDTDPDGDQISLVPAALEADKALDAEVVGNDRVVLTSPTEAGSTTFYYGIQDSKGARAAAAITVLVDQDAPLLAPVARDDTVPMSAVLGRTSVEVAVLDNDDDLDGAASELTVSTDAQTARANPDGTLSVTLTEQRQVVTYVVTDVDGLSSKAFVHVPGLTEQVPVLRPGIVPLEVTSGEPLPIDITDYVLVAEGRTPRLTDETKVAPLNGAAVVTDATNLTYTSDPEYVGTASVTFEVTDGAGPDDPEGHTAMLSLPISVLPPANLPPELGAPNVDVAAGDEGSVDLARFATDPDGDSLTFKVGAVPAGLTVSVSGATATVQATPEVAKGTTLSVPISVTDGGHPPVDGALTVEVVASTRPLAKANEDTVDKAHQGKAVSVDVLANDSNPFPETPLTITAVTVDTGEGTPAIDGDKVTVTPKDTFFGVMVVRYRVQDATKDPDREVEGRIQINVQGRPDAPGKPTVEEVRSRTVVLSWEPPANNGAEITGYTVTSNNGYSKACGTTTCTLDGLTNDVRYTFTVVATNEVNDSDASVPSAEARPDEKPDRPAPPTLDFGDTSLKISWVNKTYTDRSPIQCVNLRISPSVGGKDQMCVTGTQFEWTGLKNGTSYTVEVQAVNAAELNGAPDPSDWSGPSAAMVPAGVPFASAAPRAERRTSSVNGGVVDLSWSKPDDENGDAVSVYYVDRYKNGAKDGGTVTVEGATTLAVSGLDNEASYTFTVTGENKAGRGATSPASAAVVPFGIPGAPGRPGVSESAGNITVTWPAADANGSPVSSYTVRASNGTAKTVGGGTREAGFDLPTGSYTFTVTAKNAAGDSPASSASPAIKAYTVPAPPSVSGRKSGATSLVFDLSAPGDNGGSAITHYEWSSGERATSITVGNGYSQTHSRSAKACNAAGCSGSSNTVTLTTDPKPNIKVVRGSSAGGGMNYFRVAYTNLPAGNYGFVCRDQQPDGSWTTIGGGYVYSFNLSGSGTTGDFGCWFGWPGRLVSVNVSGAGDQSWVTPVPW